MFYKPDRAKLCWPLTVADHTELIIAAIFYQACGQRVGGMEVMRQPHNGPDSLQDPTDWAKPSSGWVSGWLRTIVSSRLLQHTEAQYYPIDGRFSFSCHSYLENISIPINDKMTQTKCCAYLMLGKDRLQPVWSRFTCLPTWFIGEPSR